MKKLVISSLMVFAAPIMAQQGVTNAPIPQISIAAHGEVKITPDRANIQISVQTKAGTAAAAAAENASKQKAVINALRALGLEARDIATVSYNVFPEQRYEPNREPVVVGYNVTNTLSIELKSIEMVGRVIDVALAKGANMITSLQFYSSNTDAARQEAMAIAIRKARSDAEAAAKAAGGSIMGLLEINVGAYFPPPPQPLDVARRGMTAAMAPETPISAGDQTISVDVATRWRFASN
jgi:uncharacterized protein YggE